MYSTWASYGERVVAFLGQNWFGSVIGLIGLLLAVYQFFRRHDANPGYQYSGQKLISSSGGLLPNEVSVLYDGVEVNEISLTHIVFWNQGNSSIRGTDIAENFPLSFTFTDGRILKAEIIKVTRDPIQPKLHVDNSTPSTLVTSFSFLDPGDGYLMKVLHTSSRTRPDFQGTIVGVPKGVQYFGRIFHTPTKLRGKPLARLLLSALSPIFLPTWTAIAVFTSFGFVFLYISIFYHDALTSSLFLSPEKSLIFMRITTSLMAIVYLLTAFMMWRMIRRRCPNSIGLEE